LKSLLCISGVNILVQFLLADTKIVKSVLSAICLFVNVQKLAS